MKIGIFTDSHYSSQEITCGNRYNSQSLRKIQEAYQAFEQENCDLVICLGDLIDKESSHAKETENLKKVAHVIRKSSIPTVCVMGNHDAFAFTQKEFYELLGGCQPKTMEKEGKKLLFLDACYFKNGNHYLPGDSDWTDTFYPDVDTLKAQIMDSAEDIYIFLHQNIDPNIQRNHCLFNADEINHLLLNSGKVKAVYQGHYHKGCQSIHNGIRYVAYPAMCENEGVYFIEEI